MVVVVRARTALCAVVLGVSAVAVAGVSGCGPACSAVALRHEMALPPGIHRLAETPPIAAKPGNDIQNLYIFPNPTNPANVVLALTLHPLIPPGVGTGVDFDPNILYEFKVDNTGDFVEDLVIQAKFQGTGADQRVQIGGPYAPAKTGITSTFTPPNLPSLPSFKTNLTFRLKAAGITGFAGVREDPFFLDLNALFSILPDRANPFGPTFTDVNGRVLSTTPPNPDQFMATSFRSPAAAQDFFKGFNVLAIVLDLPRASLAPPNRPAGVIHVWATSSDPPCGVQTFTQVDRVGRPFVVDLIATVANDRHQVTNTDNPTDDPGQLGTTDFPQFMAAAGRSAATTDALTKLLVPDVLVADLSQGGPASYLGVETRGATGARFGGRALSEDTVDVLLGLVFGNTLSSLGLAPDDGHEVPTLTSDHVGPGAKHFLATFPYLGKPQ